jgi:hypothetical protein
MSNSKNVEDVVVLDRASLMEEGVLKEKVLLYKITAGPHEPPFRIVHIENGRVVKRERFGDKAFAEIAFKGGSR